MQDSRIIIIDSLKLSPDFQVKYMVAVVNEHEGVYSFLHEPSGLYIQSAVGTVYNTREEAEAQALYDDSFVVPVTFKIEISGVATVSRIEETG